MEFLQPYIPYALYALAAVAALVVLAFVSRLFRGRARGRKGMRLGIVEYCEIDQTRRLVLVRRDEVEHLVLIGGAQDLLVEGNIGLDYLQDQITEAQQPVGNTRSMGVEEVTPMRAPRAPVFGASRPVLRSVSTEEDGRGPA
jgi:hypothetical protein